MPTRSRLIDPAPCVLPPLTRQTLRAMMHECRQGTLAILDGLHEADLYTQIHPDFSPLAWHLGHIAFTEALWLLNCDHPPGLPHQDPRRFFAADGLPKAERGNLPPLDALLTFAATIREAVLTQLEAIALESSARLWLWVLQHESQHSETMSLLRRWLTWQRRSPLSPEVANRLDADRGQPAAMVEIPAGEFWQGSPTLHAIDNEGPPHRVELPTYWIDRYPVTQGDYARFIAAGGYRSPQWWSAEGWAWKQAHSVTHPLFWWHDREDWRHHPVCGVSAYEADAYCRFVGKRLPTEAEWEKAARWHPSGLSPLTYPWGDAPPTPQRCHHDQTQGHDWAIATAPVFSHDEGRSPSGCNDLLGNVWEWTSTIFAPYPEFVSFPYPHYSAAYFDGQHQVLKGGSWATRPYALRSAFRNWYHPQTRLIQAGFRAVSDSAPDRR